MRTRIRFDNEAAIFNGYAYLVAGFETQEIEDHGREREHDGTADFTETCRVHGTTLLYPSITQMSGWDAGHSRDSGMLPTKFC
jgi:hypothetical protein